MRWWLKEVLFCTNCFSVDFIRFNGERCECKSSSYLSIISLCIHLTLFDGFGCRWRWTIGDKFGILVLFFFLSHVANEKGILVNSWPQSSGTPINGIQSRSQWCVTVSEVKSGDSIADITNTAGNKRCAPRGWTSKRYIDGNIFG